MNPKSIVTPERIGPYIFRGTLGCGSFSVVKLVAEVTTNQLFACKVVPINNLYSNSPSISENSPSTAHYPYSNTSSRFETEIRIIQQLRHPGIVQLYDLLKDEKYYYIITELCPNGELFQYILENQRLDELQARYFLKQILEALKYVHTLGIVHRDIKPENLLITQDGHIKINDFGFSRFVNSKGLADTPCGSPCYASPECIRGGSYDGRKSDVWSVGVVSYAMVTGELPWTKKNQLQLFDQIKNGEYNVPTYLSEPCRNFIKGMMEPDPERRMTIDQALSHPWIINTPCHRVLQQSPHLLQISLKKLDKFFGRDPSESNIEVGLMRSCSTMMTSIEDTVREISTKARPERQTARAAAKNMLFPRRSLPVQGSKIIPGSKK
ncbi:CAMK family protein kinase [Tritrichomonas foetus]|uniref:CAMK family protein kinase n=1 Tax=Tritrichomonas foetus TaxID=1144522 RepID=A0A1J4JYA6_9EUKA|nr:CAMK family protein kinase [Tritrichomonas foetus]|eukprot:OHT03682.1 CAMK family protein kinase [Tritrichomonas foetus]